MIRIFNWEEFIYVTFKDCIGLWITNVIFSQPKPKQYKIKKSFEKTLNSSKRWSEI